MAQDSFFSVPEAISVNGKAIHIQTDFRIGLAVRELWSDARMRGFDQIAWKATFSLLFPTLKTEFPQLLSSEKTDHLSELMRGTLWFLSDGQLTDRRLDRMLDAVPKAEVYRYTQPILSYRRDAPLLYAAFLRCYGIDLTETAFLHLWKFDALAAELPEDCRLKQVLSIRAQPLSEASGDEERAALAKAKLFCRIPSGADLRSRFHV